MFVIVDELVFLFRWSNTRMRADNTSVVTLMLDPPGPPRATVLRSRTTTQRTQTTAQTVATPVPLAPTPDVVKPSPPTNDDSKHVPQNGLTIMTRYSDVDRPVAAEAPERTSLPPCATIDGRLPLAPAEDVDPTEDSDTIMNYGNPAESYFMARLLNRSRVVNTLAAVPDELAAGRAPSEPREAQPEDTRVPEPKAEEVPPRPPPPEPAEKNTLDDGGIQINEVSSSSPVEGPPKPRARRPRGEAKPAPNDRVLRSHHDIHEELPPRPATRQAASRGKPAPPPPHPQPSTHQMDRVVILSRRAPVPQASPAEPRPSVLRKPTAIVEPSPLEEESRRGTRSTRSQVVPPTPLAQKITRSIGAYARELRGVAAAAAGAKAGNSARAPGPVRRAPAARRAAARCSKENLGAARGRARARTAPASAPSQSRARPRRADSAREYPEVHSTTVEPPQPVVCVATPPPVAARSRALRSRNEATSPPRTPRDAPLVGTKRTRCGGGEPAASSASKMPKLAPEKGARVLGKRASGPWAPALALRNRLRRRLAK